MSDSTASKEMGQETGSRSRIVTWEDPTVTAAAGRQLSGLEFLRAISSGQLPGPPISITLGFRLLEVDEG
ncbi:MAG: aromatic compound degradation protein PaaI, partial [Ktedonobacterales bacterium]